MKALSVSLAAAFATAALVVAGCTQAVPAPTPTKSAAAPAAATAPAKAAEPTKAQAATPAPTQAQTKKVDYPQKGKAITMIVPWPPGNSNDTVTRLISASMEKQLGVPVEVVNKAGANTQVGMTDLAKAKPDGYTLGANSMPTTSLIYLDPERKAAFDRKSFQPVAVAVVEPTNLAVRADGPYKTTKDLIDAAKDQPGKIKIGTNGFMTPTHMFVIALEKLTGAKFATAHFEGGPLNVAGLMGGHTDACVAGPSVTRSFVNSGELRSLGVADTEESKYLPGVKSLPAQGYNVVTLISRGIVAPAGTPMEIVEILSAAVKKTTSEDDFIKKMDDSGIAARYMDNLEYAKHWDDLDLQAQQTLDQVKAEKAQK